MRPYHGCAVERLEHHVAVGCECHRRVARLVPALQAQFVHHAPPKLDVLAHW